MPDRHDDFDPVVADLLHRGFGAVQPTTGAEEVARQAVASSRGAPAWIRIGVAATAAVVVVAVAWVASGGAQLGGGRTHSLHFSGYTLSYPDDWTYESVEMQAPSSWLRGFIATGPLDTSRICHTSGNVTSCNTDNFDVAPGGAVIKVTEFHPPSITAPSPSGDESVTRVDGMPAIYSESRPSRDYAQTVLSWRIRMPSSLSSVVIIEAHLLGPGLAEREAQARQIVGSLRWDDAPDELPRDQASIDQAVRRALAALVKDDPGYGCFPMPGLSANATVGTLPGSGGIVSSVAPLPVRCDTRLEETDVRLWKLTLKMSWRVPLYAGSLTAEAWLDADGVVVSTAVLQEGAAPPTYGGGPEASPSASPPAGVGRASWGLPAEEEIGPTTTGFTALVTERACASGRSAEGRIIGPDITYTAQSAIITFQVLGLDGAQECPSNPATPVQVTLDEPLGDRQLLDGDSSPPHEPPRCTLDSPCNL
jgi:hypothetical protein